MDGVWAGVCGMADHRNRTDERTGRAANNGFAAAALVARLPFDKQDKEGNGIGEGRRLMDRDECKSKDGSRGAMGVRAKQR